MSSPARPQVAIVFTGGTISMTVDPTAGAARPALTGADLLARDPGLAAVADLVPVEWGRVPASHLLFAQVLDIRRAIDGALADRRTAGVVVVQGTDVLEETAFAWDLCHRDDRPVVVTGAMRPASDPDGDGPANLRAAIRVAGDAAAVGRGVMVVMAGQVHAADAVAKTHSTALTAFRTREGEPLGRVMEGAPPVLRERGARRVLPSTPATAAEPIDIVVAAVATDGSGIDRAVAAGARGVIVAATGSGNTHPDFLRAAVAAVEAGVAIALASRTGAGPTGPWYAFPGGGATWQRAGIPFAGSLTPVQARIALALGLGAGLRGPALAALLADPG